jgi:ABC-2 type transport system ATP-binding protein
VTPAIETSGLTRSFSGGIALDHLSLEVRSGEVLALLGPNGAGKTTTVRLLNGVLKPDSGSCRVLGLDPAVEGNELRRRTGVLTENAGLDDRLTARENLEFVARIRGFDRTTARGRVTELLDQFGMGEQAEATTQGFSTGERKRVALARSLIHDPEVLFLDEPTSGLDPAATRDVLAMINSLATEHGRTVVLATHFLGEAGKLADKMAVLYDGKLEAFGEPAALAAELSPGIDADLELAARVDGPTAELIRSLPGVDSVLPTDRGARVHVTDREALPGLVATLVAREMKVYACTPRPPSLEDVYFAIEERIGRRTRDITPQLASHDGRAPGAVALERDEGAA